MEVLIFYTNVSDRRDIENISPAINKIDGIKQWTVDTDDCDKVLRILAASDISSKIELTLKTSGYACQRMPCHP